MIKPANHINSTIIEGKVVKEPTTLITPDGNIVCNFVVRSSRFLRRENDIEEEVSFFDIEAWSKLAERCTSFLESGRGVRVVGRLKQDRWVDNEGNDMTKVKIIAEHIEAKSLLGQLS